MSLMDSVVKYITGVVALSDGAKATYSATTKNLATAATATDIFTITGSATKTVRVTKINISATQTNQSSEDIVLIKRSTANSSGTSTAALLVPHDSNSAAATATIRAYTANPTLGTRIGDIRIAKLAISGASSGGAFVGAIDVLQYVFGLGPAQAVVLRGTSEVFAVNLNSTTLSGSAFNIDIEWTEE